MAEQSKKITIYIFLFALFIMLTFFIAVHIYNIYMTSKASSLKISKGTLDCSFSFTLETIRYSLPELSFILRSSNDQLRKIFIDVNGAETEVALGEFLDYKQNVVVPDIIIEKTFIIYPEGCRDYNSKECDLATKKCASLKIK